MQAASTETTEEVDAGAAVDGTQDEQVEQTEGEQPQEGQTEATEGAADEGAGDDTLVVSLGEESPPSEEDEFSGKPAPDWVRDLRNRNRDLQREKRELEERLRSASPVAETAAVGAKPTLEGCDYDSEKFEAELTAWHERKRAAEAKEAEKQHAAKVAQETWNAKVSAYGEAKAKLKVERYDEAEDMVRGVLSETQQGVLLHGLESADQAALLVYALGRTPAKLKELAAITDPVKFAVAVGKLESQMKVTNRKTAPPPEQAVRGSAGTTRALDATEARLEAEADKTGDRTKLVAYRRDKKAAQSKRA